MTIDKLINIASATFPEDKWDLLERCETYKIRHNGIRRNDVDYIVDEDRNTITRVNYLSKTMVTKDIPKGASTHLQVWLYDRNTGIIKKRFDDPIYIEVTPSEIIIGDILGGGPHYYLINTGAYISLYANAPEDFYPGRRGMADNHVLYRKPNNLDISYSNVNSLTYLKSYDLNDYPIYIFDLVGSYGGEEILNRIALDARREDDQIWL